MTARFPCWEGALLPMVFSVRLLLAVSQKIPGFCSYWERVYESKYIAHPPIILDKGFPDIISAGINSRANDTAVSYFIILNLSVFIRSDAPASERTFTAFL